MPYQQVKGATTSSEHKQLQREQ